MSSSLLVMLPNLAATLLLDRVYDLFSSEIVEEVREHLLDADVASVFELAGCTIDKHLAMGIKIDPAGASMSLVLELLETIAPTMENGSYLLWHDTPDTGLQAMVFEQGRAVRLAEVAVAKGV